MKNRFLNELDEENELCHIKNVFTSILGHRDSIKIIKEIFNELTSRYYFKDITQNLFDYLILYPTIFKEEILYMLNYADENHLSIDYYNTIKIIIDNVPESFTILINNLKKFKIDKYEIVSLLTKFSIEHQEYFEYFLDVVINSDNPGMTSVFLEELVKEEYNFDFNLLLNYFRKFENTSNISSLPSSLLNLSYNNSKLHDFLVNNFEELMKSEKTKKMNFYNVLESYLPADTKQKYTYLSQLYKSSQTPDNTQAMLNILLEYQEEDYIKYYIQDKDINYLSEGTTAQCFKIGDDKVLKLSMMKHMKDTITKHFLLAPTKMKIIYDENNKPILYIEKQNLLSKIHNGIPMNEEDLENYFNELKRLNMVLIDPHCYRREYNNFGFLNDYHEATLVGVSSHEELPDWFKRRPVVLFDIDMVKKRIISKKK